jgi:TPP-dependent pyruvate/acetoin dehydrogenase alpha subunit
MRDPLVLLMRICTEDRLGEAEFHENPLVPNKKLRQMYVAMAEMRLLDEHIARLQARRRARRRLDSTLGQEACRVSTAIDLGPGDLVSDSRPGVATEFVLGAKIDSLLRRVVELGSESKEKTLWPIANGLAGRQMPWVKDAGDGLKLAVGAALSFKTLKRPNVVVAYVREGEVAKSVWREVLELASKLELPIIFVILPGASRKKKSQEMKLSARSRAYGVPGIPVDASDAVALYRVAQESMGRTRGGGGPVLIEGVALRGVGAVTDPLKQMQTFLLSRKVCTKAWLAKAGDSLRRRIDAVKL